MKYQETIRAPQTYIVENNLREIQLSDTGETHFTLLGGQELAVSPEAVRYLADKSYITRKDKKADCESAIYAIHDVEEWDLSVDVDD